MYSVIPLNPSAIFGFTVTLTPPFEGSASDGRWTAMVCGSFSCVKVAWNVLTGTAEVTFWLTFTVSEIFSILSVTFTS